MKRLLDLADATARVVTRVSVVAGLCLLPLLFLAALIPVIGRNLRVSWTSEAGTLQPVQIPLFFALVMLSLGMILLRDGHVRIDLFRRRQSQRTRAWVDLVGTLVALLPFSIALVWLGTDFAAQSFALGETADIVHDYPLVWMVKAVLPLGGALLLLAGLSAAVHDVVTLLRPRGDGANGRPPA